MAEMTDCRWCSVPLWFKKLADGRFSACEDKELTKVHICPKRPRQGEGNQEPEKTVKPVESSIQAKPLSDDELRLLHGFCRWLKEPTK